MPPVQNLAEIKFTRAWKDEFQYFDTQHVASNTEHFSKKMATCSRWDVFAPKILCPGGGMCWCETKDACLDVRRRFCLV